MVTRAQLRREHEAGTPAYEAWKARNAVGNLPRTYVRVDTVTGEVTACPELCRDGAAAEELAARMRSARAGSQPAPAAGQPGSDAHRQELV